MKKRLSYSAFLKNVKDTVKHYEMLSSGEKVLVAVSGGADSVCLLAALLGIRRSLGIEVILANLDHGIRGKESRADSRFVKALADKLGVKAVMGKADMNKHAGRGASLEEKARGHRYRFLERAAKKYGCAAIATGHTMDDQAETVVMKMIYGSSMSGIAGIPPVREGKGVRIIRPLIRTSRADIIDFIDENGLSFVEDSSNKDIRFLRNKIRIDVLPYLEKCNPGIRRTLVNLADTVREDIAFIEEAKSSVLTDKRFGSGKKINISIAELLCQPKAVRKAVFKELFIKAGGDVKKLTYRHWMDMERFIRSAPQNGSLDFPGRVKIIKKSDKLIFDPFAPVKLRTLARGK